jgi:hypothetical protein
MATKIFGALVVALSVAFVVVAACGGPFWAAMLMFVLALGCALAAFRSWFHQARHDLEMDADVSFGCVADVSATEVRSFFSPPIRRTPGYSLLWPMLGGRIPCRLAIQRDALVVELDDIARWMGLPTAVSVGRNDMTSAVVGGFRGRPDDVGKLSLTMTSGRKLHLAVRPRRDAAQAINHFQST